MAKEIGPISATYCADSNSYMTSCRNQTDIPGINMHYFSKDETLQQKWIRFVRISIERFPSCEKAGFMLCIFFFIWWGQNSVEERIGYLFKDGAY